jgi:hypothetical protein
MCSAKRQNFLWKQKAHLYVCGSAAIEAAMCTDSAQFGLKQQNARLTRWMHYVVAGH